MLNVRWAAASTLGIVGAAVSSLTSVCCVIPALAAAIFGVLGASGSVTLASLAPYRPWMMSMSAVLLSYGLYTSFRTPCAKASRAVSVGGAILWIASLWAWIALR
jgi:hypothetical protein